MSAYTCMPGKGSEYGVGWNMARYVADHHDVWVLTREDNRSPIEAQMEKDPVPGLNFVYFDLPYWARWWKRGMRGLQLYYYLWQVGVYRKALRLHQMVNFDLIHHTAIGKYWAPSFLSLLPPPFIWGPVGGGESAPRTFLKTYSARGVVYEIARDVARWLGEHDPFVRMTARKSNLALSATPVTCERLSAIGANRVERFSGHTGLSDREVRELSALDTPEEDRRLVFLSVGRLLHWKGFHLALSAFAKAELDETEYWIVGQGPEKQRLLGLARELGLEKQVTFWGRLPREETLRKFSTCDVFIHPSLHDFFPTVCLEAMAAGKPIICLDIGGPAVQVTPETGMKIPARQPVQTVTDMAAAMQRLAHHRSLRGRMGQAALQRVQRYTWERRVKALTQLYGELVPPASGELASLAVEESAGPA